jgi:anaphase-promoting complex subunit 1
LLYYLDQFIRIARIPSTSSSQSEYGSFRYDEELARSNARMCQDVLALSSAIVMAGTGDIPVLRRLRALHGGDNADRQDKPDTPYGSHLAAHLAIGALFLGCGTATFGSSNMAIAALLVAFYPVFPTNVMDNRSHLQAFRHFWVLATEQRCLVVKDVLTNQPVSVPVLIKMKPGLSSEPILYRNAPCLLPPLDQIESLSTASAPQYWDVKLDFSNGELRAAFGKSLSLFLKKRPPREAAFTSTLRALGKDATRNDPLSWVFGLDSLQRVTYAEREAILDNSEHDQDTGAAVDARMEMQRGILEGGDRERLEGAKLLFEWASVREKLRPAPPGVSESMDSQATIMDKSQSSLTHQDTEGEEDVWWMGDGVVEDMKGQVWLATRDGE